ncbi:hypothetical protein [Nannocystis pusilla]
MISPVVGSSRSGHSPSDPEVASPPDPPPCVVEASASVDAPAVVGSAAVV